MVSTSRARRVAALATAATLSSSPALAHNNLFLPGDAYFSAWVQAEEVTEAIDDGILRLRYGRLSEMLMLCGYAGFRALEIVNFEGERAEQFVARVREARRKRGCKPGERFELQVLVVNRDFDIRRRRPGEK